MGAAIRAARGTEPLPIRQPANPSVWLENPVLYIRGVAACHHGHREFRLEHFDR